MGKCKGMWQRVKCFIFLNSFVSVNIWIYQLGVEYLKLFLLLKRSVSKITGLFAFWKLYVNLCSNPRKNIAPILGKNS